MKTWTHKPGSKRTTVFRNHLESCRSHLKRHQVAPSPHVEGLLLIDDDPVFCKAFSRACQASGIPSACYQDLPNVEDLRGVPFSCAIVDFFLPSMDGLDVVKFVESVVGDIPVVLISSNLEPSTMLWPASVKEFISKSMGLYTILDAAIEASEVEYFNRCIMKGVPAA